MSTGPSAQERGSDARVDGDVQAGRLCEIAARQRKHCGRDMLGQHLVLEDRALGIESPQLLFWHAVDSSAFGTPAAGEDARTPYDTVRVDAVDADAELAKLGREQS